MKTWHMDGNKHHAIIPDIGNLRTSYEFVPAAIVILCTHDYCNCIAINYCVY